MGQKQGFLNLLKNSVINSYWFCSIIKIRIICCVRSQIQYLGKSCLWDLHHSTVIPSDCRIFKSSIASEQINETASFFACWDKFTKLKDVENFFWLGMVKIWFGQSGLWTLKLTVSQKWTDVINWFFACWYKFTQM